MDTFTSALRSAFGCDLFSAVDVLQRVHAETYPPLLSYRLERSKYPARAMGHFLATHQAVGKLPVSGTGKHAHLYRLTIPLL